MSFTRALFTSLAVWGAPGPASAPLNEAQTVTDTVSVSVTEVSNAGVTQPIAVSDTVSVSVTDTIVNVVATVSDAYITEMSPRGSPGPYYTLSAKSPQVVLPLTVSDTLSVQWNEEPVDQNFIVSGDLVRVTLAEVSALYNRLDVIDTLSSSVSEAIALVQAAIISKPVSDTLSVTLTDASAVNVTVAVTDTLSTTLSAETSAVATFTQLIDVMDTLSVSVADATTLQVFTGVLAMSVADVVSISLAESATQSIFIPTKPLRIRIMPKSARIRITSI